MNVSITCAGECVGLEEIDDGVWSVYFGPLKFGSLLGRHMRIEDEYGRLKRSGKAVNMSPTTITIPGGGSRLRYASPASPAGNFRCPDPVKESAFNSKNV